MKKIKITNRKKFIKSISFLIIIMATTVCILTNQSYSNTEQKYKVQYVTQGETLWKIAQEEIEKNPYFQGEDIRNVILEIKTLNHMTTSNILEGIEIKIPIY